MNSKERVRAAIVREQPDRTPCDFWAEPSTINRLFEHVRHCDKERLLKNLGIDIRHLDAKSPPEIEITEGIYQNFWGERYTYKKTPWGPMREDTNGVLDNAQSLAEIEAFSWPTIDSFDYSHLPNQCRQYEQFALIYGFADIWFRPALVRGLENMLIDMIEHPDWVHFLCRKFTDFYLEDYARAAEITAGQIDMYLLISDLGTQFGPMISPELFRQFVAPYLKEIVDHVHSLGAFVLFHSCGNISAFIPEFINLGIDVLDPIQPTCPDMSPERLKSNFGHQLSFHGGIDLQQLLSTGTIEQVRAEVQRYCHTLGAGGGYILAPAHLFQPDVPPQNILAFYEALE
ncbi:MAG: uroporphyrinogen decarboxylase family protein [Planctomycetota bacterium]|jgi:uroporphyrinogen decarboxylase